MTRQYLFGKLRGELIQELVRKDRDLVARGEKIICCQAGVRDDGGVGAAAAPPNTITASYKEDSGTRMAAPHVSGVIAAFLSIRHEFIDRPDRVKEMSLSTAAGLRRDRGLQGSGLVELMRLIQSVRALMGAQEGRLRGLILTASTLLGCSQSHD